MERSGFSLVAGMAIIAALQAVTPLRSPDLSASAHAAQNAAGSPTNRTEKLSVNNNDGPWTAICSYLGADFNDDSSAEVEIHRTVNATEYLPDSGSQQKQLHEETKYLVREHPSRNIESCIAHSNRRIRFKTLIATVPDPVHSQLSLEYDRSIEALERAASISGYSISSYWVPWIPNTEKSSIPSQDPKPESRETEPGVLVFSGTDDETSGSAQGLLIFLVAETPAAGINQAEFARAVKYTHLFSSAATTGAASQCDERNIAEGDLLISGPQFSGSLHSLPAILQSNADGLPACTHINTPNASNPEALKAFQKHCRNLLKDKAISFTDSSYDDASRETAALTFFHSRYLFKPTQIAFLEESSSGYKPLGEGTTTAAQETEKSKSTSNEGNPLELTFPRGIGPLRNAYQSAQDQSKKNDDFPAANIRSLPLDLYEWDTTNHDVVPTMSRAHSAVSQDGVVRQISRVLRERRIKAVVIYSTDSLDALFLLRYLRQSNPDLLLALPSADVLFLRTGDPVDFVGTLVFTDMPLFSDELLPVKTGSSMSDRIYLSARMLLENGIVYSHPRDAASYQPDLWAAVVGDDGFWPLATLNPKLPAKAEEPPFWPRFGLGDKSRPARIFEAKSPTRLWGIICATFFFLSLLHCCLCLIGMWPYEVLGAFGSRLLRAMPDAVRRRIKLLHEKWYLEYFVTDQDETSDELEIVRSNQGRSLASIENRRSRPERAFYLFVESIVLLLSQLLLLIPTWVLAAKIYESSFGSWQLALLFLASAPVIVTLLTTAVLFLQAIQNPHPAHKERGNPRVILAYIAIGIFASTLMLWLAMCLNPGSGFAFAQRVVSPMSGVSPVMPLLLLLAGVYLWGFINCRRMSYFETRRPELPSLPISSCGIDLASVSEEFKKMVGRNLIPNSGPLFLVFGLLVLAALTAGLIPRSVDGLELDVPLNLLVLTLWIMVLFAWFRFISVWRCFRRLLRALERSPLRYAFSRLPEAFSWSPVWKVGGAKRSYLIQTRSLEYINCILGSTPAEHREIETQGALALAKSPVLVADTEVRAALDPVLLRENAGLRISPFRIKLLRKAFLDIANGWILELEPWLTRGGSDSSTDKVVRQNDLPSASSLTSADKQTLKAEFIALRFVAYIRYIGLHMRNLLILVSLGFALSLLALKSYPFQQRETISSILIGAFLILSAGIAVVFAEMDRDAILSRISNTDAGKLDWQFAARFVSFATIPVLTIIASKFPAITSLLFSWIRPGLEALK